VQGLYRFQPTATDNAVSLKQEMMNVTVNAAANKFAYRQRRPDAISLTYQ
jgi:hypothetical protein